MLTQEDIQTMGREMLTDCRVIEQARQEAGLPSERLPELLRFYRHHGLERTLLVISLGGLSRCSLCKLPSDACRCDEPIPFQVVGADEGADAPFFND